MILSRNEARRRAQEMNHDDRVRFDTSSWIADEMEDRYGFDWFMPRDWGRLAIDAAEHYQTIQYFADRVKRFSARFGAPVEVSEENYFASDTSAPDLRAKWQISLADYFPESAKFAGLVHLVYGRSKAETVLSVNPSVDVFVRVLSPKGCKIDPRTPFVAAQRPTLHPECKSILDELADAEEVRT